MPRMPISPGLLPDGPVDLLVEDHRRDRQVRRRELLGDAHDVGPDAEGLAREAVAGAEEAGDDLVGDHQHVVLLEHRLDLLEVGPRRNDRAARGRAPGSATKAATVSGPSARMSCSSSSARRLANASLALAGVRVPVPVVAAGVEDVRDRQVEALVHRGQARERARRHRDAVVAVLAGDDLLLLRLAAGVVVVPHELAHVVVGLGARVREPHPRHRHRSGVEQPLRKVDGGQGRALEEGVVGRELAHLRDRGLDQALVAEPERRAPQPRHALDVLVALEVLDVDPVPLVEDERSVPLEADGIGHPMQERRDIAGMGRVENRGHGRNLL